MMLFIPEVRYLNDVFYSIEKESVLKRKIIVDKTDILNENLINEIKLFLRKDYKISKFYERYNFCKPVYINLDDILKTDSLSLYCEVYNEDLDLYKKILLGVIESDNIIDFDISSPTISQNPVFDYRFFINRGNFDFVEEVKLNEISHKDIHNLLEKDIKLCQ